MFRLRAVMRTIIPLLSVAGIAAGAEAAGNPDAAKGLIAEHCSGCHAVPGYSAQGLPTVEAPSFQAMANDPDTYPEQRLRDFLWQPHWPMTQFRLSPSDIDNIIAYMKSLRTD